MEIYGELEAERALDALQSAVAAESGIPVRNASSKRSFAPDAEVPDTGEERESAPRRNRRTGSRDWHIAKCHHTGRFLVILP